MAGRQTKKWQQDCSIKTGRHKLPPRFFGDDNRENAIMNDEYMFEKMKEKN